MFSFVTLIVQWSPLTREQGTAHDRTRLSDVDVSDSVGCPTHSPLLVPGGGTLLDGLSLPGLGSILVLLCFCYETVVEYLSGVLSEY